MADEYKINTRDVDDTTTPPAGAYYIPTDDIGGKAPAPVVYAVITTEGEPGDYTYHCDKTLAELLEAIEAGSYVVCRHGDIFSPISGYSDDGVTFSDYYIYDGKLTVNSITVAAEDTITTAEMTFTADE